MRDLCGTRVKGPVGLCGARVTGPLVACSSALLTVFNFAPGQFIPLKCGITHECLFQENNKARFMVKK